MKTIIELISNTILTIALLFALITGLVFADMTYGFTSPTEVRFDGIAINKTGINATYETYKDPAKSMGTAIYTVYYAPILEEIGL